MTQIEQGYRFREPAEQTIQFMKEQQKLNNQIETFMATSQQEFKNIREYFVKNDEQHEKIIQNIEELRGFFTKILLAIGAGAVVIVISYLLIRAGLPSL